MMHKLKALAPEARDFVLRLISGDTDNTMLLQFLAADPTRCSDLVSEYSEPSGDLGRQIGYRGEAIVYQKLQECGCFKHVEWPQLSRTPTSMSVEVGGNEYYINETGEHYDIVATDYDDKKHYFEVKSSSHDRRQFSLSPQQFGLLSTPKPDQEKYLVRVLWALSERPQVLFLRAEHFDDHEVDDTWSSLAT